MATHDRATPRPPWLGRLLLRLRRLGDRRDEIENDLHDLFQRRAVESGRRRAARRYLRDAISLGLLVAAAALLLFAAGGAAAIAARRATKLDPVAVLRSE